MSEQRCKFCQLCSDMRVGYYHHCVVKMQYVEEDTPVCTATPADFAAIRRALSAVDPVTAGLERLARAYHTAAWEGDVIAPSEVVDAWDALLDAGWTPEESESTP